MLYTDTFFLYVFGLVAGVSRLLRPWPAIKEWFLIAFSLVVIASWGYFDVGLFLAVLAVNFAAVRLMMRSAEPLSRRILIGAIVLNIATLTVFKYTNFLGGNLGALTGIKIPTFPLGIPLAISFYIFHLISYLVDLHAKKVKEATLREYLFYLSFFPHVIAGPIVRAWQLVPQIGRQRHVRTDGMIGAHYLVTGFFLKMVCANNIGTNIDRVWDNTMPFDLSTCDRWIVAFLYYCQIYGDFAGYSLMALGMARLLGYRLPPNFRSPMRAITVQDFWRRWHITLSRWLRDYIYIPMGGGRVSRFVSARNVMATMLLGGLWHGAGWGFVIWGGMQGLGIVLERALGFTQTRGQPVKLWAWWIVVQLWITLAWVFFRAPTLSMATHFMAQMLTPNHGFVPHVKVAAILVFALPVVAHNFFPCLLPKMSRPTLMIVLCILTGLLLVLNIIVFSPESVFIYFRF